MLRLTQLSGFGGGGSAAPRIVSSSSVRAVDGQVLAFTVTTDQACTLAIGGTDAAKLELASNSLSATHTLRWASNGTKDPTAPDDADTDNHYLITLTPTNVFGLVGDAQSVDVYVDYDWLTTFAWDLTLGDQSALNGVNVRQKVPGFLLNWGGTVVRLRLQGGAVQGFTIDELWIGEAAGTGDDYDMKASTPSPAQFKLNGSGTIVAGVNESVFTDPLTFTIDEAKDYIVAAHFSDTSNVAIGSGATQWAGYHKLAADETSTADVSGYTAYTAAEVLMIRQIDVATP